MTVKTKIILSRTGIGFVVLGVILGTFGELTTSGMTEIVGLVSTILGAVLKIIREFKG